MYSIDLCTYSSHQIHPTAQRPLVPSRGGLSHGAVLLICFWDPRMGNTRLRVLAGLSPDDVSGCRGERNKHRAKRQPIRDTHRRAKKQNNTECQALACNCVFAVRTLPSQLSVGSIRAGFRGSIYICDMLRSGLQVKASPRPLHKGG